MRGLVLMGSLVALLATGCAPNPPLPPADPAADVPGFWQGLWHGFTMLFTFVLSLFNDGVGVYATPNSGHLYDLGFLLGIMMFFGGSCGGARKRS